MKRWPPDGFRVVDVASGRASLRAYAGGTGPPVVFLHAGVADARMWRDPLPVVARTHLAIAYDRRGFGSTLAPAEPHRATDDLLAVLDALAPGDPAVLVGSSQGGRVAVAAALRAPERVRGLVLLAPAVAGAPPLATAGTVGTLAARLEAAEEAGALDEVNRIEAHVWLDGPLEEEGRVTGPARECFLAMNGIALTAAPPGPDPGEGADDWARLGELHLPVRVLVGDRDVPGIGERCAEIVRRVPGASLRVLAGSAHLPTLDAPHAATAWIVGALA